MERKQNGQDKQNSKSQRGGKKGGKERTQPEEQ